MTDAWAHNENNQVITVMVSCGGRDWEDWDDDRCQVETIIRVNIFHAVCLSAVFTSDLQADLE